MLGQQNSSTGRSAQVEVILESEPSPQPSGPGWESARLWLIVLSKEMTHYEKALRQINTVFLYSIERSPSRGLLRHHWAPPSRDGSLQGLRVLRRLSWTWTLPNDRRGT